MVWLLLGATPGAVGLVVALAASNEGWMLAGVMAVLLGVAFAGHSVVRYDAAGRSSRTWCLWLVVNVTMAVALLGLAWIAYGSDTEAACHEDPVCEREVVEENASHDRVGLLLGAAGLAVVVLLLTGVRTRSRPDG